MNAFPPRHVAFGAGGGERGHCVRILVLAGESACGRGGVGPVPVVLPHARAHVNFQVGLRSRHGKTVMSKCTEEGVRAAGAGPSWSVTPECSQKSAARPGPDAGGIDLRTAFCL